MERQIFINGIPTDYTITIYGEVYSYINIGSVPKRKLNHMISDNGYHTVNLSVNDKMKTFHVHRLVATHFIPNPENKPQVNHKDGNKNKNWASNLEWNTEKENMNHAYANGLAHGRPGESHPCSTISDIEAMHVCELLSYGLLTYSEISEITGISYSIIKKIANSIRWKSISSKFKFPNYKQVKERCKMEKHTSYSVNDRLIIIARK